MYELLNKILSDKKGGTVFLCFGIWHIIYMAVIFSIIFIVIFLLRNKETDAKQRAITVSINCAFTAYVADFFIMPLAYGEIDIERLPFHICTAMCVMCFLSRHNRFLGRFKYQLALLGFIANLIYTVYPAGLMWYQIHPLSYRVIHTLFFHGSMTAYGLFVLAFDDISLEWKKCYKELLLIIAMTLWALLGNTLYNGTVGGYSHSFNWFFVVQDPFYMLPSDIAPYIMPFIMTAVMFAAVIITYSVYFGIKKVLNKIRDL